MKIIDPKSDLGFKTILVDQPDIFIDVVNSLIPLPKPVVDVTYISAELLPEINGIKNTIIDVSTQAIPFKKILSRYYLLNDFIFPVLR
jgi:hypothetical protein